MAQTEKMKLAIYPDQQSGSVAIAKEIASIIREKNAKGQTAVLGLATGSSPLKVYAELIRMHKEEGLSFKNVKTFNLDEYYGLTRDNDQSYWYFMHHNLFDHIDIPAENVHISDGTVPMDKVEQWCQDYEKAIEEAGGLDFQLLGIGRTGHIGFNEPPSDPQSKTRMIHLHEITKKDAAPAFGGFDNVPSSAITMGVGTIMKAKRIILMAWGANKADIIQRTVEGEMSDQVPATYLQAHPNCLIVLDEAAAARLARCQK